MQATKTDQLQVISSPSVELMYFVQCTVQCTMQCKVHYSVQCRLYCQVFITGCKKCDVPFTWTHRYSLFYSTLYSTVYSTLYITVYIALYNLVFSTVQVCWVSRRSQGTDIRDRERDRDQSMHGPRYQYGSNVAILARLTFKLEIQVPQLKLHLRDLNTQDHRVFVQIICGSIWERNIVFGLLSYLIWDSVYFQS